MAVKKKDTKLTDEVVDPKKIRDVYKPGDDEEKIIKMVYDRKHDMEQSEDRQLAMQMSDKAEKAYEAWRQSKGNIDIDWQSNHVVPITTGTVEAALAEMVDQNEKPLILPRGSEDVPKAQVMRLIYDYTWDVSDGNVELFNVLKDMLIKGTAIGQEFYWKDRRIVSNIALDKDNKENYVEHEIFDYDDCYLENVKLEDFYVDEKARGFTGPHRARDCIRRYIMHIEDFRLFFHGDVWNHLDNAKYVKAGGDTNYYEYYKPPSGIDHSKDVEVLWYWSIKPKDLLVIVANDVVVRWGPNPYRHKQLPFARAVDLKRTHRFYGKGEPELLESIQDEMNLTRRMMIDRNHLDIDKMFAISSNLEISDEDVIARPHGVIPTNDPNGVRPIEYGDVPRSVQLGKEWLQEDAVRATGIDDRSQAVQTPTTATQAAIMKESTLKRIKLKMRILENEFLVPVARMRVANIIQFYSQPILEKIVGDAKSAQYQQQLLQLQQKGQLEVIDGETYKKSYREIRTQDKHVTRGVKGNVRVSPKKGINFFEAIPEVFVPVARGGFDIKFGAGPSLAISEPLMQSKAAEMYDRLIQLALAGVGYDPVKLGDLLLTVNHYEPDDLKTQQVQEQDNQAQRLEMLTQLAMEENKMMMKGQNVPSTPYASPTHTQLHIEFMNSAQFQGLPNNSPIIENFINHVTGELVAQQARGGGQGAPNSAQTGQGDINANFRGNQQQPNDSAQLREAIPALIRGGENGPVGL